MRIRVKSNPTLHTSTFDIPSLYLPVQNCLLSTKPFPPYYSIQSIIPPRVEERLPHRLLLLAARMRWLVRESSCIWNVRREVSNTSRWLDYRPRYFRGCAMRRRGEAARLYMNSVASFPQVRMIRFSRHCERFFPRHPHLRKLPRGIFCGGERREQYRDEKSYKFTMPCCSPLGLSRLTP